MKNPFRLFAVPLFAPPRGSKYHPVKIAVTAAFAVFLTVLLLSLAACPSAGDPPVQVTGVSLDKTSLSLRPGASAALSAGVIPENASNQAVRWASNAPAVAAVDEAGTVTALAAGTAVITVTTEDGGKTASCTVTVAAAAPGISGQPQSAVYSLGATAAPLTVTASSPDGGTLSYRWYSAPGETGEGTAVDGAANASYTPPTDTLGTVYYYAAVTNTIADNGDGGTKTASLTSERARIEVNDKVNARAPVISAQPQSADYDWGDAVLTVTASSPDGGTLSYQWYHNAVDSNSGGTAVDNATASSYTPAAALETVYYYVEVTNTITDNGDGGEKTKTVTSDAAAVSCSLKSAASVGNYITAYTAANPGTGTAADPVPLPVTIDLSGGGWTDLLSAIANANSGAGVYAALDLSACIMEGTEFDPGTANTGESKIVSLVLPDAAESIKAGTYGGSTFKNFTALTSVSGAGINDAGGYAFYEYAALTTVSLPAATTIGGYAFTYCAALETLSLPAVTSIGIDAFVTGSATALTVILPQAAPTLSNTGSSYTMEYHKTVTVKTPGGRTGYDATWQGRFNLVCGARRDYAAVTLKFEDL